MKELIITKEIKTLFDDEDFEKASKTCWKYTARGYVALHVRGGWVFLHGTLLAPTPCWLEIDHIDRNKLNNQKKNLRIVTHKANGLNNGRDGVFRRHIKYEARVCRLTFGYFDSKEVAERVAFVAKAHIFYNELLPLRHLNLHLTDEESYKF